MVDVNIIIDYEPEVGIERVPECVNVRVMLDEGEN